MSLPVIVRPLAERDLLEAQRWYEGQRAGLGSEFRGTIDAVFRQVGVSPLMFPAVYRDVRRAIVRRFPYSVYFVADSERVQVIGCLHMRRSPRVLEARVR